MGQRKNPAKNELIGGHSPDINNSHSNYAVEEIATNLDGTKNVKLITQYPDGNISNIKTVGNSTAIGVSNRYEILHLPIIKGLKTCFQAQIDANSKYRHAIVGTLRVTI